MADKADRHILYEDSVQCVESEIDFIDDTFKQLKGRRPKVLREDFCGTAKSSCEWVTRRKDNRAISIDIDSKVLDWGRVNNVSRLSASQAKNIRLLNEDVLMANVGQTDTVLAMNFSYWTFKDRQTMIRYFRRVYEGLVDDGIFFLDAYGGYEAFRVMTEITEYDDFSYVWDQAAYNPITGACTCKIHFKFKDGSKLKNAFTYDWRLWTLPELTEMLSESGFKPTVYWEGTDEDGEGNGEYRPTIRGEPDAGWIAYIVAEK